MENNKSSKIICNSCNICDASPVIHCSVCCSAFHYKCMFPDVPESMYEHLVDMQGIVWHCPADRDLTVSKLLDRISLMERKLMDCPSSFDEVFRGALTNTKTAHTQTSPAPPDLTTGRRILRPRAKRNASVPSEEVPEKRSKTPKIKKPSCSPVPASGQLETRSVPLPANEACIAPKDLAQLDVLQTSMPPTPADVASTSQDLPAPAAPSSINILSRNVVLLPPPPKAVVTGAASASSNETASEDLSAANDQPTLVVVPPSRSIFLSRLAIETNVDDIKCYIAQKLAISSGFGIRKFESHGAKYSSFLLRCDDSIYEPLIDSKNWPRHMKVDRFFPRRSRHNSRP